MNPLIMAWLITAIIRIMTGQGVVSAITAAGIISRLWTQWMLTLYY